MSNMNTPPIFWSLDIETLGTTIDSAVTQIGLALFERQPNGYHCTQRHTIDIAPEEYDKRHVDPATIAWYQQKELTLPSGPYLNRIQALWTFTSILASVKPPKTEGDDKPGPVVIFSKGPHFDFAILRDFFGGAPWHYRAPRDFRSVVMLSSDTEDTLYGLAKSQTDLEEDLHDAGYDAWLQGVILVDVFEEFDGLCADNKELREHNQKLIARVVK